MIAISTDSNTITVNYSSFPEVQLISVSATNFKGIRILNWSPDTSVYFDDFSLTLQ